MGYGNLAGSYFLTGRFAEAEQTIQSASEGKLDFPRLHVIGYSIAVLQADQEQMDRAVASARGKRRLEHWMAHEQALARARAGCLQVARQLSNQAIDLALQEGVVEAAEVESELRYLAAALTRRYRSARFPGHVSDSESHRPGVLDKARTSRSSEIASQALRPLSAGSP
jgi:hypothetical protein